MATIRDVARESGVSVATVSYVLNNGPRPVREETRRLVLAAMERLNYHPNAVARALSSRRVNTLGVLFGNVEAAIVTNAYVNGVLQGVMTAAAETGFNVMLFTQPWDDSLATQSFHDGRTDGVLLVAPLRDSGVIPALSRLGLPLVVISSTTEEESGVPYFDVDNVRGARLATEHLLELGHRRIAHVTGDENLASAQERRDGFLAAMHRANREPASPHIVGARYSSTSGYAAARRLLLLKERPTAIFAGNDGIALGALQAARDLGISVPNQLSLVGFDDVPMAALVTPGLTTIRQPLAGLGERATRLLVARIEGEPFPTHANLAEPELILRGSTAQVPHST